MRLLMCNLVTFIAFVLLSGCSASPPTPAPIAGDTTRGSQLFTQGQDNAPPCSTCHQVVRGQVGFSIGPNLSGIAERASKQVAGLTGEEYLRHSIIEPGHYVVSGYRDIMYPDYDAHFTEQDIQDLIAYLLTL
jgi:cytochrome c553